MLPWVTNKRIKLSGRTLPRARPSVYAITGRRRRRRNSGYRKRKNQRRRAVYRRRRRASRNSFISLRHNLYPNTAIAKHTAHVCFGLDPATAAAPAFHTIKLNELSAWGVTDITSPFDVSGISKIDEMSNMFRKSFVLSCHVKLRFANQAATGVGTDVMAPNVFFTQQSNDVNPPAGYIQAKLNHPAPDNLFYFLDAAATSGGGKIHSCKSVNRNMAFDKLVNRNESNRFEDLSQTWTSSGVVSAITTRPHYLHIGIEGCGEGVDIASHSVIADITWYVKWSDQHLITHDPLKA